MYFIDPSELKQNKRAESQKCPKTSQLWGGTNDLVVAL